MSLSTLFEVKFSTIFDVLPLYKEWSFPKCGNWSHWPDPAATPATRKSTESGCSGGRCCVQHCPALGKPLLEVWLERPARKERSDRGQRRAMSPKLLETTEALALQKPPLPIATLFRQICRIARDRGENVPNYKAVYRVVRNLPADLVMLAHEGTKELLEYLTNIRLVEKITFFIFISGWARKANWCRNVPVSPSLSTKPVQQRIKSFFWDLKML